MHFLSDIIMCSVSVRKTLLNFTDTGDATPRRHPARRVSFAVHSKIAQNLKEMQQSGVIEPSNSPWASPVVLVRKKDGTLRFCVDYRGLNSAMKVDQFPLPQIDDLLDQLGKSRYFTTLDLALWLLANSGCKRVT